MWQQDGEAGHAVPWSARSFILACFVLSARQRDVEPFAAHNPLTSVYGCVFAEPRTNGRCKTTLRQCRSPSRRQERERRSQMSCGGSKRRLPPLRPQNSCCSWLLGCGQLDQDCSRGLHAWWARIASVRSGCEVFRSALIEWTNARFDCDTSKTTAGCLLGSRSICLGTPMAICFHADQPMYWSIYSAWRW